MKRLKKSLKTFLTAGVVMALATLTSCEEDPNNQAGGNPSNEPATVRFNLTDAPATTYDAVMIDIQEVQVHIEDTGWVTIDSIQTGVYDLLKLANGIDTVLAQGEVPSGKLSQIRLILGDSNYVVVNGVWEDLKTPSAQTSGLKLNVHYDLQPGLYYEFWLDFDANRSIVETGNGMYILKPVIRVFTQATTGAIEGYINPPAARPFILAYDATDSASAVSDSISGYYLISGLNPGTWTVEYDADTTYTDTTLTGVSVTQGMITDLDTLNL